MPPIEDGAEPFLNATQYRVPPATSPSIILALTSVTTTVTLVLLTLATNIEDTDGITTTIVGAAVGTARVEGGDVGIAVGDAVTIITEGSMLETAVVYPALTSELVQAPVDT
jgi:hypothetical protein